MRKVWLSLAMACALLPGAAMATSGHVSVLANLPGSYSVRTGPLSAPSGLLWHPSGVLVGTAYMGGAYGNGGVFTVTPDGSYNELLSLTSDLGTLEEVNQTWRIMSAPTLALDAQGSIYGWSFWDSGTANQGGSVFKLSLAGNASKIYHFGTYLQAGGTAPTVMSQGPDGNFYGLTTQGGPSNAGVLFKLTPDGQESVIYSFIDSPPTGLVIGTDGNFYGTMPTGGFYIQNNQLVQLPDVIFKITPSGTFSVMHAFDALDANGHNTDGSLPDMLIQAADGNFYGASTVGGVTGGGVIFRMTPDGQYTVLHTFDFLPEYSDDSNGGYQARSLQMGSDGNLYGVTYWGGSNAWGSAFRLSTSGVYTTLHSFDRNTAAKPTSLTAGPQWNTFYGTTEIGGAQDGGTVFKMVLTAKKNDLTGNGHANTIAFGNNLLSTTAIGNGGLTQTVNRPVAGGYYPVATGDFDGDGVADILWTSANNDLYIWYGHADGTFTSSYAGTYPAGWSIAGVGDVDGDGHEDILWINPSTHQFAYWLMNGSTRVGSHTASYTAGYYPVAIGDFDGDGKVDVVWTSANRDLWLWTSTGNGFSSHFIATYPANWSIAAVADINGDGTDDLVWSSGDGSQWGYWLMHPGTSPTIVSMAVPASVAGYSIAGAADYYGDGRADILWTHGSNITLLSNGGGCDGTDGCTWTTTSLPITLSNGHVLLNSNVGHP